jgi:hypothetical protein
MLCAADELRRANDLRKRFNNDSIFIESIALGFSIADVPAVDQAVMVGRGHPHGDSHSGSDSKPQDHIHGAPAFSSPDEERLLVLSRRE